MAIELTRSVDENTLKLLNNLDRVDHGRAQELADRFNSGAITSSDAFNGEITSSLAQYASITKSGGSVNPLFRNNVLPLSVPASAKEAIAMTDALPTTSGDQALAMRAHRIIPLITSAIS